MNMLYCNVVSYQTWYTLYDDDDGVVVFYITFFILKSCRFRCSRCRRRCRSYCCLLLSSSLKTLLLLLFVPILFQLLKRIYYTYYTYTYTYTLMFGPPSSSLPRLLDLAHPPPIRPKARRFESTTFRVTFRPPTFTVLVPSKIAP